MRRVGAHGQTVASVARGLGVERRLPGRGIQSDVAVGQAVDGVGRGALQSLFANVMEPEHGGKRVRS